MIISFEGGEGVGKTTHVRMLCSYLEEKGLPRLSIREPGGSDFSEQVRALFMKEGLDTATELLLVLASRRHNIKKIIEPGLSQGKIIIIDRFIDSTLVYQGVVGGLGRDTVKNIMELTGTWLEPDLTYVLDMDPKDALNRIRPGDKFENMELDYHYMLRDAFLEIAKDKRHHVINSDQNPNNVSREIISIFDKTLQSPRQR